MPVGGLVRGQGVRHLAARVNLELNSKLTIVVVCREAILLGTGGARVEGGFSTCVVAHTVIERGVTIGAVLASSREVDQAAAVGYACLGNIVLVNILSNN